MQIKSHGYGIKGWYGVKWYAARMQTVSDTTLRRVKILDFWGRHGLAATMEAFSVSRRTLYNWQSAYRPAQGKAHTLLTPEGYREFCPGDRMLFTQNDKSLQVMNGSMGTVESIENGRYAVKLDNGKQVNFTEKDYSSIDHGYATTVHKAQGVTVDRSYVLASPTIDKNLSYVAMTRHREESTMYAGRDDFQTFADLQKGVSKHCLPDQFQVIVHPVRAG